MKTLSINGPFTPYRLEDFYYRKGGKLKENSYFADAAVEFIKCLAIDPDYSNALRELAAFFFHQADIRGIAFYMDRLQQKEPLICLKVTRAIYQLIDYSNIDLSNLKIALDEWKAN